MNKKLKLVFFSLLVLFSLFLTSCRYNMFWENNTNKIGETKDFIISQNTDGEYYISGFTNKGLSAKNITIPEYVSIDDNQYKISYVADIFKHHSYVRMLNINIPSDKINIKGCNSIRVIQISQDNLINPESFFKGLNNIDIYINDYSYTYEVEEFDNNIIHYGTAPKLNNFDNLTIYEYIKYGIVVVGIIISAIAFYALFVFIKSDCVWDYNSTAAKACCGGLIVYVVASVILILFGQENLIYIKGIQFIVPLALVIAIFITKAEVDNNVDKLLIGLLIASGVAIIVDLIFLESISILLANALAIIFIALLVGLIKVLHNNKINALFIILSVITLLVTPVSVYLCDLLLSFIFGNLFAMIISILILIIAIVVTIIVIRKVIINSSLSEDKYMDSIPLPEFNGIFASKLNVPYGFKWELKPVAYLKGDTIYIRGRVRYEKLVSGICEHQQLTNECSDKIWESVEIIMDDYYREYPNAKSYKVDIRGVEVWVNYKR